MSWAASVDFGSQVRGFKPDRTRRTFQGEKILSTPSFGREVKPFVPCRKFTARKRSLNVTWKPGIFRQNSSAISCPSSSSFHYCGLWWRHLAVQVGKTKDQGLYNKPSAAVHPGALAAGTLPQYNKMSLKYQYMAMPETEQVVKWLHNLRTESICKPLLKLAINLRLLHHLPVNNYQLL